MDKFQLVSDYKLSGDQPEAVDALVKGIESGMREQTLMGVTGSGKTFTMANVIARINRPTLVLAHNKILAAQLCSEFKEFFPNNAVEYFVSYYDYYQPEAYVPSKDVYIEKDSSVNDEIDKLPPLSLNAVTLLSLPAFLVSTPLVTLRSISPWWCLSAVVWRNPVTDLSLTLWVSSMSVTI